MQEIFLEAGCSALEVFFRSGPLLDAGFHELKEGPRLGVAQLGFQLLVQLQYGRHVSVVSIAETHRENGAKAPSEVSGPTAAAGFCE